MQSLLLKNMVAFKRGIQNHRTGIHQVVSKNNVETGSFTFKPLKALHIQLAKFKRKVERRRWNEKLLFLGFKGTFKVEFWIYLEERLRDLEHIRSVDFVDTQIDFEHLVILKRLLQWIQPINFELKFEQNEIDDLDMEDFIYNIFNSNLQVQKILILSNPGIFKGHFIMKLQSYLQDKYIDNPIFYYHLEINPIFYSLGIKKIYRADEDQDIQKEISELKEQLLTTCYYDLNFTKCFTSENNKAFEYLIKQCYHEDNLEQLSSLIIRDCNLGTVSTFKGICQNIATAKGLLTLDISKQSLLNNSMVTKALMGDRYDQLRINTLIFEQNLDMVEKAFKEIAQSNLLRSCKKLVSNESLTQALPTLYKMFILTETFLSEVEKLKSQISAKHIPKLTLEELDISKLDNYNRHDLTLNLLKAVVYTEFSGIKRFCVQNVDVGRANSYITAIKQFNEHMNKKKQLNSIYSTYKHPMFQEQDVFKEFIMLVLFTRVGGYIEIVEAGLIECFKIQGLEDGFKAALAQILQFSIDDPEIRYTLKQLKIESTTYCFAIEDMKSLLFTKVLQLESLELISESLDFPYSDFQDEALTFFKTLEPDRNYSVRILKLNKIGDFVIDLGGFIMTFLYNKQVQLEELEIIECSTSVDLEKLIELDLQENQLTQENYKMSLKHLAFGNFTESKGYREMMRYITLSKFCRLKSLRLEKIIIKDCLKELVQVVEDQININIDCLEGLKTLSVGGLDIDSNEEWHMFSKIFIFTNNPTLNDLIFKDTKFTKGFHDGLAQSILPVIELYEKKKEDEQLAFPMTSLKLVGCTFEYEIFTLFLTNIVCNIKHLEIINCEQFEHCVSQFKSVHIENTENVYTFSLVKVVLSKAKFVDIDTFQWFLKNIVLNDQGQILEELSLIECDLTDDVIVYLANLIREAKEVQKQNQYNKSLRLRLLNFENNPNIGQQAWIKLFNQLLNTQIENKAKQSPKKKKIYNDENCNNLQNIEGQNIADMEDKQLEKELQLAAVKEQENIEREQANQEKMKIMEAQQIQITEQQQLNQEYIDNNQLCLIDKIMNNSQQFSLQYPQKLLELEVDMKFADDTKECKSEIYLRIIKGFIMFPGSKLETLKLSNLDLDIFMEQSESALTFARKYNQRDQQLEGVTDIQLPLKVIEINSISIKSPDSNRKFAQLYVCNPNISPIKLIATSFDIEFIEELLDYANKSTQQQSLEELELVSIVAHLNQEQSQQFFSQFVIGNRFNLKSLKLCKEVKLTDFINQEYLTENVQHISDKSAQLQTLDISLETDDQAKLWSQLLLIIYRFSAKLISLKIQQVTQYDVLQELVKERKQLNFDSLKKLSIDQIYTIDLNTFMFLQSIRSHLSELTIQEIQLKSEDIEQIKQLEPIEKTITDCLLTYNKISGEEQVVVYEYFVFSQLLQFTRVINKHFDSFKLIVYPKDLHHLIYLNLNFQLLYNSANQLDEASLTLLGENMIYNEESQLRELVLYQCHLKPVGITALTKGADSFRQKIENENRQSSVQLSLTRFTIYYSLYIADQGAHNLSNDIWFFQYITIERIETQVTNWNENMNLSLTTAAQNWIQFQVKHQRPSQVFQINYFDIGRNEFIKSQQAWDACCDVILFSDLTPKLETVNLHFMSMTDEIVGFICNKAVAYFQNKPKSYVHPIKRISYQLNTALTHKGWQQITEQFFFHPCVQLEELNLVSTMLDEEAKLAAIYKPILHIAKLMPNKKLKLYSLLCYNISLKDRISEVMSQTPLDYKEAVDIPVSISNECKKFGLIDGVPESIGGQQQLIQKVIGSRCEFVQRKWLRSNQVRFSAYHFNFVQHFLVPLNDNTAKIGNKKLNLFFSYKTLDTLAKYFNYASIPPGDPYPLGLLFQADTYTYLRQKSCLIKKIYLLPSEFATNEEVSQMHVLAIWENVKSNRTSIDQIITKYTLNDDLVDEMFARGYQERDIVQLIRIIPPSKIRLQNTLTLQSIKAIYSIFWDSYHFEYSNMTYDFDNYLNIGIGYALREQMYQYQAKNKIGRYFKFFLYHLFNLFVSDAEKYKFDDEVKRLNKFLSSQKLSFLLISILNLLFFAICILCPYLFTHYVDGDEGRFSELCFRGVSIYSDITYYSFALLSFIVEAYLYKKVSNQVPGHLKKIFTMDIQEEDSKDKIDEPFLSPQKQNQVAPIQNKSANVFKNFELLRKARTQSKVMMKSMQTRINSLAGSDYGLWAAYLMNIVVSQLAKLDFYNDVGFIMRCYYCDYGSLFYAALVVTLFNVLIHLYNYMKLIYHRLTESDQTVKLLNTSFINDFFFISIIGRNIALSSLLDQVAPFNVTVIPNNFITRFLMPNQAGKSMNNSVKNYLLKFSFEDLPQIILQLLFVISEAIKSGGQLGWTIYFTIVISAITILNSLIKFMSIRPSTLTQDNFDKLAEEKCRGANQLEIMYLKEEMSLIKTYSEISVKDVKSENGSRSNNQDEQEQLL